MSSQRICCCVLARAVQSANRLAAGVIEPAPARPRSSGVALRDVRNLLHSLRLVRWRRYYALNVLGFALAGAAGWLKADGSRGSLALLIAAVVAFVAFEVARRAARNGDSQR